MKASLQAQAQHAADELRRMEALEQRYAPMAVQVSSLSVAFEQGEMDEVEAKYRRLAERDAQAAPWLPVVESMNARLEAMTRRYGKAFDPSSIRPL